MNQGLCCGSSPAAAAAAAAWRPRECPLLFISVRHRRSGGDKTGRPVRPQRRNYAESPDDQKSVPSETKKLYVILRLLYSPEAQEYSSWLGDKRGVRAGGDPSGSRRSISIQNHAYDFSKHHSPRVRVLEDSAQWVMELWNFS